MNGLEINGSERNGSKMFDTYDSEPQKNLSHKQSVLFYGPSRTNRKHQKTPPNTIWFIIDLEKDQVIRTFSKWPKKVKIDHFEMCFWSAVRAPVQIFLVRIVDRIFRKSQNSEKYIFS